MNRRMTTAYRSTLSWRQVGLLAMAACIVVATGAPATEPGTVHHEMPSVVRADARHFIYLHGRIFEAICLKTGLAHGEFCMPREEWVEPTVRWALGEG
jgi:hypothetical protein